MADFFADFLQTKDKPSLNTICAAIVIDNWLIAVTSAAEAESMIKFRILNFRKLPINSRFSNGRQVKNLPNDNKANEVLAENYADKILVTTARNNFSGCYQVKIAWRGSGCWTIIPFSETIKLAKSERGLRNAT